MTHTINGLHGCGKSACELLPARHISRSNKWRGHTHLLENVQGNGCMMCLTLHLASQICIVLFSSVDIMKSRLFAHVIPSCVCVTPSLVKIVPNNK